MLNYEAEVMVHLESTHRCPRVTAYKPKANKEDVRMALDLIDEVRDKDNARVVEYQYKASSYCNL